MDGSTLGEKQSLEGDNACDFDLFIWGWTPGYEPSFILSVLTTDQIGGRSDCMYSNAAYDDLYNLQMTQVNEEERLETVNEMQKMILEEAPYVALYYQGKYEAYRIDKFDGWVQRNGDGTVFNNASYLEVVSKAPIQKNEDSSSTEEKTEESPTKQAQEPEASNGLFSNPIVWAVIAAAIIGIVMLNRKEKR